METLVRQINESAEINVKTKNAETFVSRIDLIIRNYQKLVEYEQKGIIVTPSRPSVMLSTIIKQRDIVISEFFDDALDYLKIKLLGLKTLKARVNQINKFKENVESFIPRLTNKDSLNNVLKKLNSLLPSKEDLIEDFVEGEYSEIGSSDHILTEVQNFNLIEINKTTDTEQKRIIPFNQKNIVPHKHAAQFVIVSDKNPSQIVSGMKFKINFDVYSGGVNGINIPEADPSTVFKKLPVKKPSNPPTVEPLPYYPAYSQITPEQRWIYLDWLEDICRPIEIGYVFIYYYGLERQLLSNDFEQVFDEMLILRQFHNNPSLIGYSDSALLYSSLYMRKIDRINQLLEDTKQNWKGNDVFLVNFILKQELSSKGLINFARGSREINLRYHKENPELFEQVMAEKLTQKYGRAGMPIVPNLSLSKIHKEPRLIFANISFPRNMRQINVPDFLSYEPIMAEVIPLFEDVHQRIKEDKRKSRNRITK